MLLCRPDPPGFRGKIFGRTGKAGAGVAPIACEVPSAIHNSSSMRLHCTGAPANSVALFLVLSVGRNLGKERLIGAMGKREIRTLCKHRPWQDR